MYISRTSPLLRGRHACDQVRSRSLRAGPRCTHSSYAAIEALLGRTDAEALSRLNNITPETARAPLAASSGADDEACSARRALRPPSSVRSVRPNDSASRQVRSSLGDVGGVRVDRDRIVGALHLAWLIASRRAPEARGAPRSLCNTACCFEMRCWGPLARTLPWENAVAAADFESERLAATPPALSSRHRPVAKETNRCPSIAKALPSSSS
jgi:hypothetical protein